MGTTAPAKFTKMVKSFKTRWMKALTSGKYQQGEGELKTEYKDENDEGKVIKTVEYCCLGVAKEIFALRAGRGDTKEYLSQNSCLKIGLDPEAQQTLATLNDNNTSFKDIAKWIDKNI